MIDREQNFGAANIPASERLIGSDSLWRDDPPARAAYSGNPGFTDGADTLAVAEQPHDSILARPEIAEALEQVYLSEHPGTAESGGQPVRTELAVPGLAWLREHLDKGSPVLRTVKRQYNILEPQETRRQEIEQRKQESAEEYRAERQAKQAEIEARLAHQAECAYQMDGAVAHARDLYPNLDFGAVIGLAAKLPSHKEADGTTVVDESKDFRKAISRRIKTYMATPQELVEDFKALNVIQKVTETKPGDFDTVSPYMTEIGVALDTELETSVYDDFSEEVMDKWLSLFETNQAGVVSSRSALMAKDEVPDKPISFALDILSNSLAALAARDPRQFISRIHTFANKGFNSGNEAQFHVTYNAIMSCLQKPLPYHEVLRGSAAALVMGNLDDEVLQQAVDLSATLEGIGLFQQLPKQNDGSLAGFSESEAKLIDEICPSDFLAAVRPSNLALIDGDNLLKTTMQDFRDRAVTPEGKATTMYGNLVSNGRILLPAGKTGSSPVQQPA